MVVGAFPIIKLGSLLLKQISKPIANFVKERAKAHPFFRTYVCMPPAHFYNWCEIKTKMWILNLGRPVNIPSLNEAMAIELGANLLGEGIVFCIAAGILIAEYNRQINKEAVKEEARREEMTNLLYQLQELYFQVERQDTQIRELMREIGELESRKSIFNKFSKPKDSTPPGSPINKSPLKDSPLNTLQSPTMPLNVKNTSNVTNMERVGFILQTVQELEDTIVGRAEVKSVEPGILQNALKYLECEVLQTA